jgi:hypothetical protein
MSRPRLSPRRSHRDPETPLLPEDGVLDEQAVETVAKGERPVPLTQRERKVAVAMMTSTFGITDPREVAVRLGVRTGTARVLMGLAEPRQRKRGQQNRVLTRAQRDAANARSRRYRARKTGRPEITDTGEAAA